MSEFVVTETGGVAVAVPQTSAALGRFLALQRAINEVVGYSEFRLAEDGRIGPATVTTYNRIVPAFEGLDRALSVTSLATYAESYARMITLVTGSAYDDSVPEYETTTVTATVQTPGGPVATRVSVVLPKKKSTVIWWALGALALGGVITLVVLTKRPPADMRPPARARV